MNIRPATVDDARAFWEAESATAAVPGRLASRPEEISIPGMVERILTVSRTGCFFVAERDGELLGHVLLEPMSLIAVQHVYRLTLVVHPERTGRGVGTTLLQHVQRWATSRADLHKIELNVRATNTAAIRLYTRLGFQEEGRLRNRIRLPDGAFIDDLLMAWFPVASSTQALDDRRPTSC
jgi:ribosomal protein S18 acetylase RimI-like enzyme